MKVVASMMAGPKEKVMVIEVGGEQYMLGITSHNINHLATLSTPLQTPAKSSVLDSKASFQQKLVQAMAQGITGKTAVEQNASVQATLLKEKGNG